MEIVNRTRVLLQLDALAGHRGLLQPVSVVVAAAAVHVVFHDGAEWIFTIVIHLLGRSRGLSSAATTIPSTAPVIVVPSAVDAAPVTVTGRRGFHCGHDVVRRSRTTVAALAALHDHHLDERHHRVAYLAHLPGQFELLEQAHVAVALERRVLVAEREQLRHAQCIIVAKQSGQLAVCLGQRLELHTEQIVI